MENEYFTESKYLVYESNNFVKKDCIWPYKHCLSDTKQLRCVEERENQNNDCTCKRGEIPNTVEPSKPIC